MTGFAYEDVDSIVHVLNRIVGHITTDRVRCVREGRVVALFSYKLIRQIMQRCSIGLELRVGFRWLAVAVCIRVADGAVIIRKRVPWREVRGGRLWVERIVIQGVRNVHATLRRVDREVLLIDRVWHCCIVSPVPVGNAQCHSCGLILAPLRRRIGSCDALSVSP